MAYDVEPLVTLETKRRSGPRPPPSAGPVVFEHDATHAFGRIVAEGKGYSCEVLTNT
jgi:hypothetical protein